jgi:caffeoyl-CoA O-methyltransferase
MTSSITPNSTRTVELSTPSVPRPVTPLGIAVEHLEAAVALLAQIPNVSDDLSLHLQKALVLMAGLDPYLEQSTTPESPGLTAIAEKTHHEAWQTRFDQGETVRPLEQEMLSGHVEGQTLKLFVHMTGARRILDIGMFTGYSALAMAEALPAEGCLVACEVDPYTAEFAQALFRRSPHGSKIRVELGAALETLDKLADSESPFDFVFIDADKREYIQYYQKLLDSRLLAENGYICVDNTLFQGQVYSPEAERSANGQAIAQFNQFVAADSRTEQVLLPLRDGLTLIRRV